MPKKRPARVVPPSTQPSKRDSNDARKPIDMEKMGYVMFDFDEFEAIDFGGAKEH